MNIPPLHDSHTATRAIQQEYTLLLSLSSNLAALRLLSKKALDHPANLSPFVHFFLREQHRSAEREWFKVFAAFTETLDANEPHVAASGLLPDTKPDPFTDWSQQLAHSLPYIRWDTAKVLRFFDFLKHDAGAVAAHVARFEKSETE